MSDSKKRVKILCLLLFVVIVVSYMASTGAISLALSKTHLAYTQASKPSYRIGETRTFVIDNKWQGRKVVVARLEAKGEHTDIWVDIDQPISKTSVSRLNTRFDNGIYPRNIEYFATESTHGQVDKVSILITDLGSLDGYFDSGDLIGQNRLNLIYLDADVARNEPTEAENTLAHEFAHLLYHIGGGADVEWLDEGLAVYAEYINGGNPNYYVDSFRQNPSVMLVKSGSNKNEFYGAAFLFVAFSTDQVEKHGNSVPDFTRALIKNSYGGINGINATLHDFISNRQLDSVNEIYRPNQLSNYAHKLGMPSVETIDVKATATAQL